MALSSNRLKVSLPRRLRAKELRNQISLLNEVTQPKGSKPERQQASSAPKA